MSSPWRFYIQSVYTSTSLLQRTGNHVHCTSPIQEPSRHARRMVKRRIVRFRIVRKRFWERKRNQKFPTGLLPKRPEAESMDDVMSCQDLENPKEEEVPLAWHTCTSLPQNGCIKLNLAKKKLTAKKIPDFATWQSFSKCKTIHPIDLAIPSQKETRKAKEAVGWVPLVHAWQDHHHCRFTSMWYWLCGYPCLCRHGENWPGNFLKNLLRPHPPSAPTASWFHTAMFALWYVQWLRSYMNT